LGSGWPTLRLAFTATGKLDAAEQELDRLRRIAAEKSLDGYRVTFSRNGAKAILDIATEVLAGELAAKRGDYDQAIARLHRAVLLQDNLIYMEPPDWHVPVRQSLGAVLLEAGRAAEAEAIYWQDLSRNRENGWSLFGLMKSLRAQGNSEQAAAIENRFRSAWSKADGNDVDCPSRFMGEEKDHTCGMGKQRSLAGIKSQSTGDCCHYPATATAASCSTQCSPQESRMTFLEESLGSAHGAARSAHVPGAVQLGIGEACHVADQGCADLTQARPGLLFGCIRMLTGGVPWLRECVDPKRKLRHGRSGSCLPLDHFSQTDDLEMAGADVARGRHRPVLLFAHRRSNHLSRSISTEQNRPLHQ
jgi:hypothetical protein